jgi:hypothetical protein
VIRTLFIVFALGIAVLFLPLWVQLALFFIAVWTSPYRIPLLAPAILGDVLYGPTGHVGVYSLMLTLVVSVLILIRWLLVTQTRFAEVIYGMEA